MIELKDLTIGYIGKKKQPTVIASGINATLTTGQLTCLLGPNGVGKSTLLKTVTAFLPKLSGEIVIDGNGIESYTEKQLARKIGVVLTERTSVQNMTVEELVALGRSPYTGFWGRLEDEDKAMVAEAMQQAGIKRLAHRYVDTLSGGERQRAWIAMALAQRPQVLLLDEPTTYLDICHQLEVMQLLDKLNKELGLTVVMVIHDLNHAIQYADYVAVIKAGRLVVSGEPKEIVTSKLLADVFRVQADEFACSNGLPALVPITVCR